MTNNRITPENITRLKPSKLYLIQQIVGVNALLTDVIKAMQASYAGNLNTSCPTCSATGFLTTGGIKFPCYTCKGYLLYHTNGGSVTPPTNPFEGTPQVIIKDCLPSDIYECIVGFPSATTLALLITAIQGNVTVTLDFDCSRCDATGIILINISCPTCMGMQRTVRKYQTVDGVTSLADVSIPPPDPLPVATNPFNPS